MGLHHRKTQSGGPGIVSWSSRVRRAFPLDAKGELSVLLEEVESSQSAGGEETERHRCPELGLDAAAGGGTEQCETASQCELGAVVLVLLEEVSLNLTSASCFFFLEGHPLGIPWDLDSLRVDIDFPAVTMCT